jgi:voltage-gated potassium channel
VSFTSGDFFGEMALLEHRRHKHEVSAKTRCRVYVLDTVALAQLDRRHPEIMQTIRKVADERVQKSLTDLEAETATPGDGQAPA